MKTAQKGFTLIELLVVIGILATLLAITLIAINPARQFSQANNTQRNSNVSTILNAVHQYAADNRGALPAGITTTVQTIADTGADICADVITRYIAALPVDPSLGGASVTICTAAYNTGYTVVRSVTDGRITVAAPMAELGSSISVTR
ncbi:hypothetical protein A3D05_05435 [Candidatus Gottesmanbacteria bacterium RIFCSPHIGHO2_02_FULL_40_24]|uniref:Type II secretion system protein GspG C-terminal domain-containing protein n=1 Tax=Candidatus Gottesmanbacteria bacterium RIFCSPHIGHO2_01_FULL_40_15 TaxID=1798376 RepID=A0A1F5Z6V2_9BACT|nr:MAG: hypothetical protein A2777_02070 [Candidatus Gottesmanbacteria bacterium RIFCSPHIGHO2_01_FULL_40_15]OGG16473.1 MAG: hypothetical protein A3D05_05435 [Candidatus Gottesmanbacteria bacterium RIFCSPHIGHO2_02_FULL_40_24]OGG22753.1 MAG: hypothetical protein A3B48_03065 [Candidatus Gottesmanbacteria bacterium RIFCSPLOWO2_01_FULL_40_10]OGG25586.1 MAG: hypothetical protein A3E42_04585 [Candidatus Gottesmanbacteria bacterium RIFCSPHIGHO2_12_FULL_40_13]OGG32591.1 MAG: hypothetical protein A3I80_0